MHSNEQNYKKQRYTSSRIHVGIRHYNKRSVRSIKKENKEMNLTLGLGSILESATTINEVYSNKMQKIQRVLKRELGKKLRGVEGCLTILYRLLGAVCLS